ncbi:amidohydrolase [Aequoribacter sp.]|uniref:amidohydrolase n=1 Tax=Aequoribacter sp. TaxID=2847771 RepID=UPI003F69D022
MRFIKFWTCMLSTAFTVSTALADVKVYSDAHKQAAEEVASKLWDWSELGYLERRSSELMQKTLEEAGFRVRAGVADIETAFVADYGNGEPVIAMMAEMDALPGASQQAAPTELSRNTEAGHACGHNLFGGGVVGAALAVKGWMQENGIEGTLRVLGTPAEEGGSGKVYLVRAGLFDDVDVALHWHPSDSNQSLAATSLANKSAKFSFTGIASHASAAPERGRSALDGVEAMNYMVNLMREHVPSRTRIHYVITHGGDVPNIVPRHAEVYYYVRAPSAEALEPIWQRVEAAAKAGALGTGTEVTWEVIHGNHSVLPNTVLAKKMHDHLVGAGGVSYDDKELAFAQTLQANFNGNTKPLSSAGRVMPWSDEVASLGGSTDVGDVSWVVPTHGISTATWVPGTPPHSWAAVAASGMSIGHKGMHLAAEVLAATAQDLLRDPQLRDAIRAEFDTRRGSGYEYRALLGDRLPPLDYRVNP